MKTNARKFLSLFLSFLMVFGSVATLLPTTVMAAETDKTTDGSTIDCIIFDAGDIFTASNTIPKAKFTGVKDEAPKDCEQGAVSMNKVIKNGFTSGGYVRFVPVTDNGGSLAISFDPTLDSNGYATSGIKHSEYGYFTIAYRTNVTANNLNIGFRTVNGTYKAEDNTVYLANTFNGVGGRIATGELAVQTVKIPNTYTTTQEFTGFAFTFYGSANQKALEATDYFDIQYVGFFKSEEDAAKFDYAEYAKKTITVTNEDGTEVLGTFSGVIGDTVKPLAAAGLPYVNKDGEFAALVDSEGNAYNASDLAITDNLTLAVQYKKIGGIADADYIKNSGKTVWVNGTNLLTESVLVTIDGSEYLNMTSSATGATTGASHNFSAFYSNGGHKTADFKYVAIESATNLDVTNTMFMRPVYDPTNGKAYYGTALYPNAEYSTKTFNGTEYLGKYVYEIPAGYTYENVYGTDIAPWKGMSSTTGARTFKIKYVASFATPGDAQAFDYDAYMYSLENDLYVDLVAQGVAYSSTYVAKGNQFTFPSYTVEGGDDDVIFGGWRATDGTIYQPGDKVTVTENTTYTAIVSDPITVTLLGTDGETVLGTAKGLSGVTVDLSTAAGLPYKNADGDFLMWTDGTNLYSDTHVIEYAITLTAVYKPIKVYTANDIYQYGGSGAGHLANVSANRKLVTDPDTGVTYYQIFPDATVNPQTTPSYFTWDLPDTTWGTTTYPYMTIGYKSNITTAPNNTNFFQMTVYGNSTLFTKGGFVNQNTATAQKLVVNGSSWNQTKFTSFRIMPWGAQNSTNTTQKCISMIADEHFDISYIAFAGSEAEANAFEIEKYLVVKLTLKGEGDEEDTVVTLLAGQKYTLPGGYTQVGAEMTRIGWVDELGTSYADEIRVNSDLTLTPANETATALVYAAGKDTLNVSARKATSTLSGKLTDENGVDYFRFTPGTKATSQGADQLVFDFSAQNASYDPYDHMVWYYRTNIAEVNAKHTLSYSGTSAAEGNDQYDAGTGWSNNDSLKTMYPFNTTGTWSKKVLNPAHKDIKVENTNFMGMRFNPWGNEYAWSSTDYFDISYVAFLPDEGYANAFDIDIFLAKQKYTINVYSYGSDDPVVLTDVLEGNKISLDGVTTQYTANDGTLMVINGFEYNDTTYGVDEFVAIGSGDVNVVYAPAYILSEAAGTLVGQTQNAATFNNPVAESENGRYYEHYTVNQNATVTVAQSQAQFQDDSKTKLYSEVPYVAYSYRTNIQAPGNTWYTAYTVNNWTHVDSGKEDDPSTPADESKSAGTATFQQKVVGIVSDGEWHLAVHKPSSFGNYPKLDQYNDADMYYTSSRLAPWQTQADIAINGNEYLDVEYIGFFPNQTAAELFDYDAFLAPMMADVTVKIDGVVNEALSGKYVPGSSITLPAINDPLFTGYVVSYLTDDGKGGLKEAKKLVTSVPAEAGEVNVETLYRHTVTGDYVNEHGNLANFKAAAADGTVNVVYIGGSVTAGSGASSNATKWTYRTTKALQDAGLTVNPFYEGIGGTGSVLGAFRLATDVISHNPDLVFIDFTLNDAYWNNDIGARDNMYYEYVIRTIREALPSTEIISLHIADTGTIKASGFELSAFAQQYDAIAEHYDATSIYLGGYAAEAIFGTEDKFNEATWKVYVPDGVHPGDLGYALYAEVIKSYLSTAFTADVADAAAYELPEALDARVLKYVPQTIALDSVTTTGMNLVDASWSTFFNEELRPTSYEAGSTQTVEFTFKGTELYLYMSSPNSDAEISVTIDAGTANEQTFVRGGSGAAMMSNGPKLFFKGLENTTHTVKVTQTGATQKGYIMGILAGGVEAESYTIDLTASVGGQVEYKGETGTRFEIVANEGDVIEFTAIADAGNYLRNWHDLTTGQVIALTDANGNTYVDGSAPATISYKVTGDALINANFVPVDVAVPVRLITFVDKGSEGVVKFDGNDFTYIDTYVSASEPTNLEADANYGYVEAYWVRITQDSKVMVFVNSGAYADVYALGSGVYYQPVFLADGETTTLYIDEATKQILGVDEAPEGYTTTKNLAYTTSVVEVYTCKKNAVADGANRLSAYALNGTDPILGVQTPAYGSEWILETGRKNTKWTVSINGGAAFVASYEQEFHFNYMFKDGTNIVIREELLEEDEEAAVIVKTVATWTNDAKTKTYFSGLFELTDGLTLVNHGVMMSKDFDDLAALEGNATGDIKVFDGTIVGRISDNSENATANFAVIKSLADPDDVWFGRAFLVYTDGTNTYLVYAAEIIPAV